MESTTNSSSLFQPPAMKMLNGTHIWNGCLKMNGQTRLWSRHWLTCCQSILMCSPRVDLTWTQWFITRAETIQLEPSQLAWLVSYTTYVALEKQQHTDSQQLHYVALEKQQHTDSQDQQCTQEHACLQIQHSASHQNNSPQCNQSLDQEFEKCDYDDEEAQHELV